MVVKAVKLQGAVPFECEFDDGANGRCFGLVGKMDFLMVAEYGVNSVEPELVLYMRR